MGIVEFWIVDGSWYIQIFFEKIWGVGYGNNAITTTDKIVKVLVWGGFIMGVFGLILRSIAFHTAKGNFNHKLQTEKSENHTLVTDGIYSWVRHPSYVGWF